MGRKRLTQYFPCLLPLRRRQRIFCFYLGMRLDRCRYAKTRWEEALPHTLFRDSWPVYHKETGYDPVYQENKAHNCALAARAIDSLLIAPGETFSFWNTVRFADRRTPYKKGFVLADGELQFLYGGGLCQISGFLYWLFLHTPLTVTERHRHGKELHLTAPEIPRGVDAAVAEGWLDLKVQNDTPYTFQIQIAVEDDRLTGAVLADAWMPPVDQRAG